MKKSLILSLVCIGISISTYAFSPSEYNSFYKLNNKATFTSLIGYLDIDQEQAVFLQRIFKVTEEELSSAEKKENLAAAQNVINYNLRNAKCILSEDQYKKYLVFVNVYLRNDNNFALSSTSK